MSDKSYLADVQVGDKLYNFLEGNKEYTVRTVDRGNLSDDFYPIWVVSDDAKQAVEITRNGTIHHSDKVPYFLYAPVDVLDPKNLPPRPWKPKRNEWVWGRVRGGYWVLVRYWQKDGERFWCHYQDKGKCVFDEVAPFKGELPPGLEEEDEE